MVEAIKKEDCSSADELLNLLQSNNSLWNESRNYWVFRGHSDDEEYKLIPNAFRNNPPAKLGYSYEPKEGVQLTNGEQQNAEFEKLHEFFWAIDSQGLSVPEDNNLLRTPSGANQLKEKIEKEGWPIDDLLPLLALGQHYGIPTRLLDWTDKPLVAAYFAAKGALNKEAEKFLSVWALNLDWIIHEAFPLNTEMAVCVVTAPKASNPNLHAQGGIFTTEILNKNNFSENVRIKTVDEIVEKKWNEQNCSTPTMARLRLPCSEASKLLRLLNYEGINAATIFPGYQGVVDSIKERELWDIKERATYWMKPND